MRDQVLLALAAIAAAQNTLDRLAANAALLQLLDAFLLHNAQWSAPGSVSLPAIPAPGAIRANFDSGGLIDMPTVLTPFLQTTFFLTKLEVTNQDTDPIQFSVSDGNGDLLIPSRVLPVGEIATYTAADGRRMTGGIQWRASATGLKCYLRGYPA